MPRLGETVPNPKKKKYDEDVKKYSPAELQKHHDEALTYYIEHGGEVSTKVLSRHGKVPQSYIRKWMKEENWDKYVMEDQGDKVKVSFNANSREYNGRWYTDLRAWKIEAETPAPENYTTGFAPTGAEGSGNNFAPDPVDAASTGHGYVGGSSDPAADQVEDDLPF